MTDSVLAINGGVVTVSVLLDGSAMSDSYILMRMRTQTGLNAIPSAEVELADGDPAAEDFPLSASDDFVPGKRIELQTGYDGKTETIFKGIILKQNISVDANGSSALTVTCHDPALKMTLSGQAAQFQGHSDAEVMKTIISNAGLRASVSATGPIREHHVQNGATDWDYVLGLAQANGQVVRVEDGAVHIGAPGFDAPRLHTQFGESLMEVDLDLDATFQWPGVSAMAWDPATQTVVTGTASEPSLNSQGNLTGKTLATRFGSAAKTLRASGALGDDALKTWADASLLRDRLARIRGTVVCPGNARLAIDSLLELKGLGDRFNGAAYISKVRHEISAGQWQSTVTFGLPAEPDQPAVQVGSGQGAPQAAVRGLHIAKVLQTHEDPEGARRIKVALPLMPDAHAGMWVRLAGPYASQNAGFCFLPEVDDEVVLGFLGGDPNAGIVLGALQSPARPAPDAPDADNSVKAIVTRSQLKLSFDDDDHVLTLETPGGHKITLSDKDQSLTLTDSNANSVQLDDSGITLTSPKNIAITAGGAVAINANAVVEISSDKDVSLTVVNITARANEELTAEGGAAAELSSSGQTTVKGSIVSIN